VIVLDPQLVAFVRESLKSIWALELLLLLRRAAPEPVAIEDIVRELRATPHLVQRLLVQLSDEHLVVRQHAMARFQPARPELEKICDLLEAASRERPIALRQAIISAHNSKLRDFADAFRFLDKNK
jgi:hypothetical protein